MSNIVFRFATVQGQAIHWFLGRNCSVSPTQLGWMYASLCVVSLGIGTIFWFQGAVMILPFAWLELAAVGVAFLAYARHAADRECGREDGGEAPTVAVLRVGATYSLTPRIKLDSAVGVGVTRASPDVTVTVGTTIALF